MNVLAHSNGGLLFGYYATIHPRTRSIGHPDQPDHRFATQPIPTALTVSPAIQTKPRATAPLTG